MRESGEEGRGRRGGGGEEIEGVHIHHIVTMSLSLQLCEEELKNCEQCYSPFVYIFFLS